MTHPNDLTALERAVEEAHAAYNDLSCQIIGAYDQSERMRQLIKKWEAAYANVILAARLAERHRVREAPLDPKALDKACIEAGLCDNEYCDSVPHEGKVGECCRDLYGRAILAYFAALDALPETP